MGALEKKGNESWENMENTHLEHMEVSVGKSSKKWRIPVEKDASLLP